MLWVVTPILVVGIMAFGYAFVPRPYRFDVRNEALTVVDEVVVTLGENKASSGQLAPGGGAIVKVLAARGTSLSVAVRIGTGMYISTFPDVEVGRLTRLVISQDLKVSIL